jgi:hypothetical protein
MISTALPFLLHAEQAERLLRYMQVYRRHALIHLPATQERNTTLRLVQALQGKLLALKPFQSSLVQLVLSREEGTALQAMARGLLQMYGEPSNTSADRATTLADIGRLYAYLKQLIR